MKTLYLNNSKKHFKEAIRYIPLGSQTFSKSHVFFDPNYFPLFTKKGKNQYISDIDNNKYLDLISALGAVSVGYGISKIDKKIIKELKNGITFSLSHSKELEITKLLIKLIPSAEMVRFGKNGTDVNSAAIRLARYVTRKDHIAVCGYHGWQDWFISSTSMSGGIPNGVKQYTHTFIYNKIESLKKLFKKKKLAAVIMEPLASELPEKNFLKKVKMLCKKNKCLLIFDEVCTGFRVSMGGAQKLYNVKPDLSTFGKAMANGYPLSALVGKESIMKYADKIFYSGTFGGETLSLESCKQTINFLIKNNSIKKNINKGLILKKELHNLISKYNLSDYLELTGHPSWLFLKVKKLNIKKSMIIKTFIMHQLTLNKILFIGVFNINHSHTVKDILKIIKIMNKILFRLSKQLDNLNSLTPAKIPRPLFQVRK